MLSHLKRYGVDAVSFQALESNIQIWRDQPLPLGTGALVAYGDTGSGWIAIGRPIAPTRSVKSAVERFIAAARAAKRRPCFFAVEDPSGFGDCELLLIGEQPILRPRDWQPTLKSHRSLREQLRRAQAKGVRVRSIKAAELLPGSSLRLEIERLATDWLVSRKIEPMGFLVTLEPFHAAEEHQYIVAERDGHLIGFLSAVPIFARQGWLVEDIVRDANAPNGTTELLLDAFMRETEDSDMVTLGLAPLAGQVVGWLRISRWVTRPLYDFRGVHSFKARLRPNEWQPVWLVHPKGESTMLHLLEVLRAFAHGSLWKFGLRSIIRHPGLPPWLLALPLAPWTLVLAIRALMGMTMLLGWSRLGLAGWAIFDAILCYALVKVSLRPTPRALFALALAAATDASLSLHHVATTGLGHAWLQTTFRITQAIAPVVGTVALIWAGIQARRTRY